MRRNGVHLADGCIHLSTALKSHLVNPNTAFRILSTGGLLPLGFGKHRAQLLGGERFRWHGRGRGCARRVGEGLRLLEHVYGGRDALGRLAEIAGILGSRSMAME